MKKKILVLMIIGVSCFMLPTCKFNRKKEDKREVIWTDLREDKSYYTFKIGYAKAPNTKTSKHRLTTNWTRYIYVPNGYSVSFESFGLMSSNICIWDFSGPFTANTKKMEIFLFDPVNYEEHDTYYEVKKVEGILAYFITTYEKETGEVYRIYSKDNIIDKDVGMIASTGSIEAMLKSLEKKDFAIYLGFKNDDNSYSVPYNGYLVRSKMNGEYMHLKTKIPKLSYWFD